MRFKRIFLIVLDSVGIGGLTEDKGANTFLNTVSITNIGLPNLKRLGMHNLVNLSSDATMGSYTKATPLSSGKDTLTGHHELMGIVTKVPFNTFPNGFDEDLINQIKTISKRNVIGNEVASGTEIIDRLGEEHIKTGSLIVYTSADSVLQIAAHEKVIPKTELYRICSEIRKITINGKYKIGRIIARPFEGNLNEFKRTGNRKDYALDHSGKTVLDKLKENKFDVIAVGKIDDIFNSKGITSSIKTSDNEDGINKIIDNIKSDFNGLLFANLNDFDSLYGHRRDCMGYANALKDFDNSLPDILYLLNKDDLCIITADHGNDPSYKGTDHTKEEIPVLFYSSSLKNKNKLRDLNSFTEVGDIILDNFLYTNESILKDL